MDKDYNPDGSLWVWKVSVLIMNLHPCGWVMLQQSFKYLFYEHYECFMGRFPSCSLSRLCCFTRRAIFNEPPWRKLNLNCLLDVVILDCSWVNCVVPLTFLQTFHRRVSTCTWVRDGAARVWCHHNEGVSIRHNGFISSCKTASNRLACCHPTISVHHLSLVRLSFLMYFYVQCYLFRFNSERLFSLVRANKWDV